MFVFCFITLFDHKKLTFFASSEEDNHPYLVCISGRLLIVTYIVQSYLKIAVSTEIHQLVLPPET